MQNTVNHPCKPKCKPVIEPKIHYIILETWKVVHSPNESGPAGPRASLELACNSHSTVKKMLSSLSLNDLLLVPFLVIWTREPGDKARIKLCNGHSSRHSQMDIWKNHVSLCLPWLKKKKLVSSFATCGKVLCTWCSAYRLSYLSMNHKTLSFFPQTRED